MIHGNNYTFSAHWIEKARKWRVYQVNVAYFHMDKDDDAIFIRFSMHRARSCASPRCKMFDLLNLPRNSVNTIFHFLDDKSLLQMREVGEFAARLVNELVFFDGLL
ncbi:hypothetical protein PRIPAC_71935 [Pristionchus pacificus]|uniref:F-box domain-containing protein n=1 Tax=Pristionchus pacificus TaxID=54126 RepID=A0A2A6BZE1_PRIPA|nr:hypothetical protein PRIPAC_71935 [Pristionchus pacificus]|eukprot:PDM71250.1 hypothetical protein PRIPAC_37657 [Pristionchus pacificus]